MSSKPAQTKEFFVRIPKTEKRRLSILKFNENLNIKPEKWTNEIVKMEREDNRRQGVNMTGEIVQEYGEGSEYGRAAREESRRKKYGRYGRKYEHDKQPWKMTIEQTSSSTATGNEEENGEEATVERKVRKFRSIREASAGEHADYWVFYKSLSGNDLEAVKVDEWYQFLPAVTYKYLDAEQAEEHFKEMDKIVNQLAFKAQIQKQLAEEEERQQKAKLMRKGGSSFLKIKDEASSDEEDGAGEGGENGGGKESGKGAKKRGTNNKKKMEQVKKEKKKQRVENAEEVAAYESDDGDDEGREYDYMSDSGSDTDREELNAEKKIEEDLVGVEDEKGLKGALESDEEEEDEGADEKEKNEEEAKNGSEKEEEDEKMADGEKAKKNEIRSSKAVKTVEKMMAQKGIKNANEFDDEKDSSGGESDDEDPDSEKVMSVLFIQDKRKKQTSQSSTGTSTQQQRKRQAEEESADSAADASKFSESDAKRQKLSSESDDKASDLINEAFIRKLLEKKPHSTKQLLTKVNQRLQQLQQQKGDEGTSTEGGDEPPKQKDKRVVNQLAAILKKIEPYQFRKKNGPGGKEVLYFSMNRTA